MSNLKALKSRINSIKSTQKITKAMKLVSAAKMRRARGNAERYADYYNALNRVVVEIAHDHEVYLTQDELLYGRVNPKKALVIVIGSDRGLCGSFNHNLFKQTSVLCNQLRQDKEMHTKFLGLGNRAIDYLSVHFPAEQQLESKRDQGRMISSFEFAQECAEMLSQMYQAREFDECYVVYNHFKSLMMQEVKVCRIMPLLEEFEPEKLSYGNFEPDMEALLANLLPQYLVAQIHNCCSQSLASEHAARMNAMENATKNSEEMLKRLSLEYNRKRQAHITTELIEIISGAEAI